MRQLRDDTHLILDGEVRVYRRERSKRWQAAFVIDGHNVRISTGKRDLAEAKEYARDTFLEYKFRHKNDLPVVTKKFSDVAKLAIADMRIAKHCVATYKPKPLCSTQRFSPKNSQQHG